MNLWIAPTPLFLLLEYWISTCSCVVAPSHIATLALLLKIPFFNYFNSGLIDSSMSSTHPTTSPNFPWIISLPHTLMTMVMPRVKLLSMAQCCHLVHQLVFPTSLGVPFILQEFLPCNVFLQVYALSHIVQFYLLMFLLQVFTFLKCTILMHATTHITKHKVVLEQFWMWRSRLPFLRHVWSI
jgi:hypothetical protein